MDRVGLDVEGRIVRRRGGRIAVVDRVGLGAGGVVDVVGVVAGFASDQMEVFQRASIGGIAAVGANVGDVGVVEHVVSGSSIETDHGFLGTAGLLDGVGVGDSGRVIRDV